MSSDSTRRKVRLDRYLARFGPGSDRGSEGASEGASGDRPDARSGDRPDARSGDRPDARSDGSTRDLFDDVSDT